MLVQRFDAVHRHRAVDVDVEPVQETLCVEPREAMHEQLCAAEREDWRKHFQAFPRGFRDDFRERFVGIRQLSALTFAVR